MCDDCRPEVLRHCCAISQPENLQTTDVSIQDSSSQVGKFDIHGADARVNNDGRSHVVCSGNLEGPSGDHNCCKSKGTTMKLVDEKSEWHQKGAIIHCKGVV